MVLLKMDVREPIRYISSGQFVSTEPWIHSRRTIDSIELMIGIKGTVYMQQGEQCYPLNPSSILLILPHEPHQGYLLSDGPVSFYWCHFSCERGYELVEYIDMEQPSKRTEDGHKAHSFTYIPRYSTPTDCERISITFNQLSHVANAKYYSHYATDYWLTSILIEITQQTLMDQRAGRQSRSRRRFNTMLEWIRIHALERITVNDIAQTFNYNRDYLSRLFKSGIGMSPQEYIHTLKLQKAKEFLYQTDKSVKEIAYAVGFEDDKYFMKLFKRYEGMTPTEYRTSYYKIHLNNW